MCKCVVVNRYKSGYDVYIGLGTKWGNPYKDLPRGQAIAEYRRLFKHWLKTGVVTIDELKSMKGMRLGCSCAPLPCHGDIIARAVNIVCGIQEANLDFLERTNEKSED